MHTRITSPLHTSPTPNVLCTGTHEVQNISVSSPLPGQVRVTGDFVQGSVATGALVIVYSQSDDSDIYYQSSEHDDQHMEITVNELTGGQYGVSVFVLENGLPFSRAASLPWMLYINTTQQSTCACCG